MAQHKDWVIDIHSKQEWSNYNVKSHLVANIELTHSFFQLSLKDGFAVLQHPLMKECHFLQTMSIVEIIYEFFGIFIISDDNSLYVPVLEKPFCHIILT